MAGLRREVAFLTNPTVGSGRAVRPRDAVHTETRPVVAYADGERLGPLPVTVEVRPTALAVAA